MKTFIFLLTLLVTAILVFTAVMQYVQSQAILAQAETLRSMVIQHFFTNAAMFLLGGFVGAAITILLINRQTKPALTQIHVPQSTQPLLPSPYGSRLDATFPTLVVDALEEEAIEFESFTGWGW